MQTETPQEDNPVTAHVVARPCLCIVCLTCVMPKLKLSQALLYWCVARRHQMLSALGRIRSKAEFEISSSLRLIVGLFTSSQYWFIVGCTFISIYPYAMLWVAWMLHINPWITIVTPLIPFVTAWYMVMRRRLRNYLALLLNQGRIWDTDKALTEYIRLVRSQNRENRELSGEQESNPRESFDRT